MSLRRYDPELDRFLLLEEIKRLQRTTRLAFVGKTLEAQLGADRWILGGAVVEENKWQFRKRGEATTIHRENIRKGVTA